MALSPDGTRVVTASDDKTARVWDAATGKELALLRGRDDVVTAASFSPDGTRILAASNDKTARIWDSVPYRERYPYIAQARLAATEMDALVAGRLKAVEDPDAITQRLVDDRALTEIRRSAGPAVVCAERERRWLLARPKSAPDTETPGSPAASAPATQPRTSEPAHRPPE